ncbi:hypothetical protein ABDK56_01505 [Sphingomonas sp. ASV193]|uniref:hypothetical protein n=1 Tax=Sphingomonas sp. ASV193 TaxID=3144405 RepID=UPI0032E8D498
MKPPQPLHGWRAFAGEVGVIVLGVLLALGAQQAAQAWQERQDVAAFRQTIDHEIGMDLYAYLFRARQFDCDHRRLADMSAWLDRARTGSPMPALYPRTPVNIGISRSAWDSRDAETFRHLPADIRQNYAMFYDGVAVLDQVSKSQRDFIDRISGFAEPGAVSLADRRLLRAAIARLGPLVQVEEIDIGGELGLGEQLGIKPVPQPGLPPDILRKALRCSSVFDPPKT